MCAPPPSYAECVNNQNVPESPEQRQIDPETLPPSYETVRNHHYLEITHPIKSEIDKLKRFSESLNHSSHTDLSTCSQDGDSAIYCDDNDISFQESATAVQSTESVDSPCCSYQIDHCSSTNYAFTDEIGASPNSKHNKITYMNQTHQGKVNEGFSSDLGNELVIEQDRSENIWDCGAQINNKQEDNQTEFCRQEYLPVAKKHTKCASTETEL